MYGALHQLVFGDDRGEDALGAAEEGKSSLAVTPGAKSREPVTEMGDWEYWGKLALCVVGLQASYLTWGVLQVLRKY